MPGPEDAGLSEADRLARRNTFSAEAERYDRVRPGYPHALFERIAEYGGLRAGSRVLEVGAGTGKATRSLLDQGWAVDAVELGAGMAEVLRHRLGDRIRVLVGAFEEVPVDECAYDLVVSATAFHWLDPATRVDRVARALRSSGTAAIVWTRHVRGGSQRFFEASEAVYRAAGLADEDAALPTETSLQAHDGEFLRHPSFTDVTTTLFTEELTYGTDDYLDLIGTYSETLAATAEQRTVLLDGLRHLIDEEFDGRVVKRYAFTVVLARRTHR